MMQVVAAEEASSGGGEGRVDVSTVATSPWRTRRSGVDAGMCCAGGASAGGLVWSCGGGAVGEAAGSRMRWQSLGATAAY
jgi:hypothetical protein